MDVRRTQKHLGSLTEELSLLWLDSCSFRANSRTSCCSAWMPSERAWRRSFAALRTEDYRGSIPAQSTIDPQLLPKNSAGRFAAV
jgi:hypothetical protein